MGGGYIVSDSAFNNTVVKDSRNEVPVVFLRQLFSCLFIFWQDMRVIQVIRMRMVR